MDRPNDVCLYSRMSVCCCRHLGGSGFHPSCSPKKAAAINMWVRICTRHWQDCCFCMLGWMCLPPYRYWLCLPIPPPHEYAGKDLHLAVTRASLLFAGSHNPTPTRLQPRWIGFIQTVHYLFGYRILLCTNGSAATVGFVAVELSPKMLTFGCFTTSTTA